MEASDVWECPKCQRANEDWRAICAKCLLPRPTGRRRLPLLDPDAADDDVVRELVAPPSSKSKSKSKGGGRRSRRGGRRRRVLPMALVAGLCVAGVGGGVALVSADSAEVAGATSIEADKELARRVVVKADELGFGWLQTGDEVAASEAVEASDHASQLGRCLRRADPTITSGVAEAASSFTSGRGDVVASQANVVSDARAAREAIALLRSPRYRTCFSAAVEDSVGQPARVEELPAGFRVVAGDLAVDVAVVQRDRTVAQLTVVSRGGDALPVMQRDAIVAAMAARMGA